jgi:hypothetical protein
MALDRSGTVWDDKNLNRWDLKGYGLKTINFQTGKTQQVGNSNRYWNMATTSGRKTNSWFVRKLIFIKYSLGGGYGVEGNNKI